MGTGLQSREDSPVTMRFANPLTLFVTGRTIDIL